MDEGNRRRLTPLYGLIILGLTAIFFEFPTLWDGLRTPISPQVSHGNCMYQAFQEGECLGTVFLDKPAGIPQILEAIGVPNRSKWDGSQDELPCNRAIKLGGNLEITGTEKIKGTHLILAGKRIDVNSADAEDLRAVPGIGPQLAERIVDQREKLGGFADLEELGNIPGIGKKRLAGWAPYLKAGASRIVNNGLQNIQSSGRLLEPQGLIQK
jgi:competence ComEA-like helix-hairpin-helix protein